ncbi:MAG TPA: carbon storage regulator [Bryobacteraceae bacterium]|jgi:carbon storage regulator|nr:carbon storage regulator [Bryobacteraceae bacterium]
MLVLSRKVGEGFMIGADVEVVVLGFEGRTAKIGIRAPRHVPVVRKELQAVAAQNATALALPAPDRLHSALLEAQQTILGQGRRQT